MLQFFAARSGDIEEDVELAKRLFEERAAAWRNPQYNFNPQQINSTSRTQSPMHHRNESSVSTMSRFTPRDENGQITQINGTRRSEDDSPRSYTSNHNTPLSAAPSTSSSKTRARSGSNALKEQIKTSFFLVETGFSICFKSIV